MKKVLIIGGGPGGLTAGMILANLGYDVEVFEKKNYLGGRTSAIKLQDYTFDMGPTFLMMPDLLKEMFQIVGRKMEDYFSIKEIEPLYRLVFKEKEFFPSRDREFMKKQIQEHYPGDYEGYSKFLIKEKKKFDKLFACLKESYISKRDFFKKEFIQAIPYLDPHVSLIKRLSQYFKNEELQIAFTFQSKYLGMSPWKCPGGYSIISYIEHAQGIYHVMGGFYKICEGMAKVIEEDGGKINLNAGVKEIIVENGEAKGVILENGDKVYGDYIVVNADFGYAMSNIVDKKHLKKYTPEKLEKKEYSCSTYMIYLGLNIEYNLPHHNIIFADDYKKNVYEISDGKIISTDQSVYVQNPVVTDKSYAPEGKSSLYILAPVPNNFSGIDWENTDFKERVLDIVENKGGFRNLRKHIEVEKVITPNNWEKDIYVYKGATFNLSHKISQMLYFRPRNKFEEIKNVYLVGGGTHPGSGLPTIFESGRITSKLISQNDNITMPSKFQISQNIRKGI